MAFRVLPGAAAPVGLAGNVQVVQGAARASEGALWLVATAAEGAPGEAGSQGAAAEHTTCRVLGDELLLSRDRVGLGSLYFATAPDGVLLVSDSLFWIARELANVHLYHASVAELLLYRYVSGLRTLFKEIQAVPAGYTVSLARLAGNGYSSRVTRTAGFRWAGQHHEALPAIRKTFATAVQSHLAELAGRDLRYFLFFSGGLDSSLLARWYRGDLPCLNAGSTVPEYDESGYARSAAAMLGRPLQTALVSPESFFARLPDAVARAEAPLPVEQLVSYEIVLAECSPVGAALAGYGADFLFGESQRRYWTVLALARFVGTSVLGAALRHAPTFSERRRHQIAFMKRFDELWRAGVPYPAMIPELDPPTSAEVVRRALGCDALPDVFEHRFRLLFDERPPHLTQSVFVTYSNLIAATTQAWNRMLLKTGSGLRLPFLSGEVVDGITMLAPESYLRLFDSKPVITGLADETLPRALVRRPKKSGALPVWDWITSRNESVAALFDPLRRRNVVDADLLAGSCSGRERYGYLPLWAALNLSVFLDQCARFGISVS